MTKKNAKHRIADSHDRHPLAEITGRDMLPEAFEYCPTCGCHLLTHNLDGSCFQDDAFNREWEAQHQPGLLTRAARWVRDFLSRKQPF